MVQIGSKVSCNSNMGDSLIPWPEEGDTLPARTGFLPERGRQQLAALAADRTFRKLGSGLLCLIGTFAVALFLLTAQDRPARSSELDFPFAAAGTGASAAAEGDNPYLSLLSEMDGGNPDSASEGDTPFIYRRRGIDRINAADCLATAAWYEAGDDQRSQRSVIQVVLNRVRHPSFPNSVCAVVFEGSQLPTGCQFSFTCDGSMARRKPPRAQWLRAMALSERALSGDTFDEVSRATHFHADYVSPWWRKEMEVIGKVGSHIFYRWPGDRGNRHRRYLMTDAELSPAQMALVAASAPQIDAARNMPGAEVTRARLAALQSTPPAEEVAVPAAAEPVSDPYPDRQVILLSTRVPSGRWAVDALGRCAGRDTCRVIGFAATSQVQANRTRTPQAMDRPLFLFARDPALGRDLALWDCARVERSVATECLPQGAAQVAGLIGPG